jgi:hypothetical protein
MKVTRFLRPEIEEIKEKAAIRFALMAAIKEARGKLDLRKRENSSYARSNLRRNIPAIPIRPVESSIRLPGSGVAIGVR